MPEQNQMSTVALDSGRHHISKTPEPGTQFGSMELYGGTKWEELDRILKHPASSTMTEIFFSDHFLVSPEVDTSKCLKRIAKFCEDKPMMRFHVRSKFGSELKLEEFSSMMNAPHLTSTPNRTYGLELYLDEEACEKDDEEDLADILPTFIMPAFIGVSRVALHFPITKIDFKELQDALDKSFSDHRPKTLSIYLPSSAHSTSTVQSVDEQNGPTKATANGANLLSHLNKRWGIKATITLEGEPRPRVKYVLGGWAKEEEIELCTVM